MELAIFLGLIYLYVSFGQIQELHMDANEQLSSIKFNHTGWSKFFKNISATSAHICIRVLSHALWVPLIAIFYVGSLIIFLRQND